MSETNSFESVMDTLLNGFTHDVRTDELSGSYKMIAARLDSLQAAHDREIAQARDPQRLRGTKPDTFDGAIEALREFRWQHATNDEDAIPYINAVKEMHERELVESLCDACEQCDRIDKQKAKQEIRDTAQQEYHRGFEAGTHSMDAEHRAIAMRLRQLPLDGGSHENLSQIARAIYHADFGWTQGACASLRDELVRLMGGVSDDTCDSQCRGACAADCGRDSGKHEEVGHGGAAHDSAADSRGGAGCDVVHMDGLVAYDVLDNERRKAIAELRKLPEWYKDDEKRSPAGRFNEALGDAIGVEGLLSFAKIRDRLIHLLGGDQPSGIDVLRAMDADGTCPNDDPTPSITDELRECVDTATKMYEDVQWYELDESEEADHTVCHVTEGELLRIADRIDEQFGRICQQQEAVLQETIADVVKEYEHDRLPDQLRIEKLEKQRDELRRKVDELESFDPETSIAAFGDDNGKLRRMLSRAATLLANAEQDRDANYAYWMDCKEKVVHANVTIEELQAKLDAIRDALDG